MSLTENTTKKLVTLGILSALGVILMIFEIPYPFVPFLRIDLSDVVVLVVFVLYGWKESLLVGILKAAAHTLFLGPVGPIAIGQLTALIASMSYVLGFYITTNKLGLNRLVSMIITVLIVTSILTLANYLFITPIWFGELWYTDIQSWTTPAAFGLTGVSGGYLVAILIVYAPFNILKGSIITLVFALTYKILQAFFDVEFQNE